jgi:GNAT superfamily N-acetyltransferase
MNTPAPEGYTARHPSMDDLGAVLAAVRAHEVADEGAAEYTEDDLRGDWTRDRFDIAEDAWILLDGVGEVAGYGNAWPRSGYTVIQTDGYVHPDHRGRGIGTWLVRTMENRCRELAVHADPAAEVAVVAICFHPVVAARELLEAEGYAPERFFWRMTIDMDEPPDEPELPDGMAFRTFRPGDEPAIHELIMTAFKDNDGHQYSPFEEWQAFMMARETFNPDLWFLIEADRRIAAGCLCPDYEDFGWIRQFAVSRDYRRKGLGLALLHHAFRAQFLHGNRKVSLVVDSYNRTGAERVYERSGMHIDRQHDAYQKVIRTAG